MSLSFFIQPLIACATCRVDRDTPIFLAEQNMLYFLLSLIMIMLAGLIVIIFRFAHAAKKAAKAAPNQPSH